MEHAFIFAAGWIFFALWGLAVAALSVIAFGRDMFALTQHQTGEKDRR